MTDKPVSDLQDMLTGMAPVLLDQHGWQFVDGGDARSNPEAFAIIREAEGPTLILAADPADGSAAFARITLQVHSDLEGVGLTAAVSTALANAGIACNVIAGFHHDHLFVPWDKREEAMDLLRSLSREASGKG